MQERIAPHTSHEQKHKIKEELYVFQLDGREPLASIYKNIEKLSKEMRINLGGRTVINIFTEFSYLKNYYIHQEIEDFKNFSNEKVLIREVCKSEFLKRTVPSGRVLIDLSK